MQTFLLFIAVSIGCEPLPLTFPLRRRARFWIRGWLFLIVGTYKSKVMYKQIQIRMMSLVDCDCQSRTLDPTFMPIICTQHSHILS